MNRRWLTWSWACVMVAVLMLTAVAPAYAQDEAPVAPVAPARVAPVVVEEPMPAEPAPTEPTDPGLVVEGDSTVGTPSELVTEGIPGDERTETAAAAETVAKDTQQVQEALSKWVPFDWETSLPNFRPHLLYIPQVKDNESVQPSFWRTYSIFPFEVAWTGMRQYDCNGSKGGYRFWGLTNERSYSDTGFGASWQSAWPAADGANRLNSRLFTYPNFACTEMVYGPFSLSGASIAYMDFNLWLRTERYIDYFGWYYSCDGTRWYGSQDSGNFPYWRTVRLNLTPCLGDSTVWIKLKFTSDYSIAYDGPYVDNLRVVKFR